MRRVTAWFVVVGVMALGAAAPARAADGFWLSIAAGVAGSSTPSDYQELWFETPHGPPPIAVTQFTGAGTAEATTAGGSAFFSPAAVPVVLHPTDGYAYLANANKPDDLASALKRQMAGGKGLASATPDATATEPPAGALLLSINQSDPGTNGSRQLTVGLTDALQNVIGTKTVSVPGGGWWVIGLGPNPNESNPDPGTGNGGGDGGTGNGGGNGGGDGGTGNGGGTGGDGGNGGGPGPVASPEPTTALLAGLGGLSAFGLRLVKRRRGE